MNIVLKLR